MKVADAVIDRVGGMPDFLFAFCGFEDIETVRLRLAVFVEEHGRDGDRISAVFSTTLFALLDTCDGYGMMLNDVQTVLL